MIIKLKKKQFEKFDLNTDSKETPIINFTSEQIRRITKPKFRRAKFVICNLGTPVVPLCLPSGIRDAPNFVFFSSERPTDLYIVVFPLSTLDGASPELHIGWVPPLGPPFLFLWGAWHNGSPLLACVSSPPPR